MKSQYQLRDAPLTQIEMLGDINVVIIIIRKKKMLIILLTETNPVV